MFIGDTKQKYTLPKKILCQSSHFFSAAFENGMRETADQSIHLEEADITPFEQCMQWILTKNIVFEKESTEPVIENPEENLYHAFRGRKREQVKIAGEVLIEMVDFLVLADQLLIQPNPAAAIMLRMRKLLRQYFWSRDTLAVPLIAPIFMLPSEHPTRQLMAQIGALSYLKEELDGESQGMKKRGKSKFEKEMETIPGFAKAVLDEVMVLVASRHESRQNQGGPGRWIEEGLSGAYFRFNTKTGCIMYPLQVIKDSNGITTWTVDKQKLSFRRPNCHQETDPSEVTS